MPQMEPVRPCINVFDPSLPVLFKNGTIAAWNQTRLPDQKPFGNTRSLHARLKGDRQRHAGSGITLKLLRIFRLGHDRTVLQYDRVSKYAYQATHANTKHVKRDIMVCMCQ